MDQLRTANDDIYKKKQEIAAKNKELKDSEQQIFKLN